jgi:uncharacterized repeat protein (TIGR01451 family)
VAYSQSLSQTGALGAPGYAVTAGSLPPGLTLSTSGTISGTPTAIGIFNFNVTVFDASGCSASSAYSITVAPVLPSAPQTVNAIAGDAQVDVSWIAPASDGGDAPLTYGVTCSGGNVVSATGVSPITLSGLVNGTAYTCDVVATNSAGPGPAGTSNSVTPMGNQSITFDPQSGQTYSPGGTFAINPPASASSGLIVTYGSSTTAVCTVSGTTVSIVAAGACTLTADQPGDAAWNAAPQVTQTLDIAQAGQTLTFPAQTVASHWFIAGTTFAIAPLASSAEPNSGEAIVYGSLTPAICTVSGTTVTMESVGNCILSADQAGNDNFAAAAQQATGVSLLEPTEADLWVQKTTDTAIVGMGYIARYGIAVGNNGLADATNVRVLDTPPLRLDIATVTWQCLEAVGTACPVPGSGTGALDATIASLPNGATVRFELLGEVGPAADPADDYTAFLNTATIALPQGSSLTDPVSGNNQSSASVLVDILFANGFDTPPSM